MSRRLRPTLADYLAIAVSPVLVMLLVTSLLFFLLEVSYQGRYGERLHFIFAAFVFAAVLTARIAIEQGRERARLFAVPLGLVTYMALRRFVQYEGDLGAYAWAINLILLGVVWWCVDKLTWDCTHVDESRDTSDAGLLQTAGLEVRTTVGPAQGTAETPEPSPEPEGLTSREVKSLSEKGSDPLDLRGLTPFRIRTDRRPHAHGLWVVYFSLAALPLFGLGQLFVPGASLARRRYVFALLVAYVASGLGLLLLTSFLGLRRYLRQRRLRMPPAVAGVWMATGGVLIAALLGVAALLPRPNAEYALAEMPLGLGSPGRESSPGAVGRDAAEHDRGGPRGATDGGHDEGSDPDDHKQPGSDTSNGSERTSETGTQGDEGEAGSSKQNKSPQPTEQTGGDGGEQPVAGSPRRSPREPRWWSNETALTVIRYVIFGVILVVAAFWLWRVRKGLWQSLRELLASWRGLWRGRFRRQAPKPDAGPGEPEVESPPPPFSALVDPFAGGEAARYSAEELIRMTFAALEAWAREHGCPRGPEQTPHEFAARVGARDPDLAENSRRLADMYCRVAYAPGTPPSGGLRSLRRLWRQLREHPTAETAQPAEAGP